MAEPEIRIRILGRDLFSGKLKTASANIKRFGQGMKSAGRAMSIGITAPAVLLGKSILDTAGNFQLSMNRVKAITGEGGDALASMTAKARELGATTQFTASDAADAMGNLALAGFKTNEIMGSIGGTMQLAAAGAMDLSQAADISASIMRSFGLEAEDVAHTNDILVNTFTNTNTTLQELGEGMKFVGTIAKGMEIPLNEVSAAMGLLGNVGLKGTMAGTALRGALSKLANPAAEAVAAMQRLGIRREDMLDARGNVKGFIEVVETLERTGASAGDMLKIFGQRAGPGMAGLVRQGSAKLREMTKKVEESGAAARVAEVQMEGYVGAKRKMISAFQELSIAIAESGLLDFMTDFFKNLAQTFSKLAKTNPELLKFGTIAVAILAALGPLVFMVGNLVTAFGTLFPLLVKFGPVLLPMLKSLGLALKGLFLNPVGLAIIAVLVWMRVISQLIDTFDTWKDAFSSWGMFLKTMGYFLADVFSPVLFVFKMLWNILTGLAKFVLPKWLERKIGLAEPEGGTEPAAALAAQSGGRTNTNNARVEVDVKGPPGTRAAIVEGDNTSLRTDIGLMPAATGGA